MSDLEKYIKSIQPIETYPGADMTKLLGEEIEEHVDKVCTYPCCTHCHLIEVYKPEPDRRFVRNTFIIALITVPITFIVCWAIGIIIFTKG
jgi:hypothetical protein